MRPLVFAVGSLGAPSFYVLMHSLTYSLTDGYIYIFDLFTSTAGPVHTISVQQESGGVCGITGITFNGKQREFIAACGTNGTPSLTHNNLHTYLLIY